MRTLDQWMNEYGESHQNKKNQVIHKICVPLITFSVVGILWSLPTPEIFKTIHYLNWASIFVVFCLLFYMTLSFKMFLGMLIKTTLFLVLSDYLSQQNILFSLSLAIFVLAWIAQFIGHKIEGKKPSFLKDLAFLLIGPLWVLKSFYEKLGIKV